MSSNPCYSGLRRQTAEGVVRGVAYRIRQRECRLAAGSRPRNGDERRSLALWAVRESTSHWGLCLVFLFMSDHMGVWGYQNLGTLGPTPWDRARLIP